MPPPRWRAGAEPLYVPATEASGFLPDYAGLPRSDAGAHRPRSISARHPIPKARWRTRPIGEHLFALAERHDFIVLADECYADIYFDAAARLRAAGAAEADRAAFSRLLTFHSLSKRSGLPGLRSGMVAGDAELIAKFRAFRNVAGPQVPGPILAASAAAWRDEAHVAANRAAYAGEDGGGGTHPGQPRCAVRTGGFFLWLEVGNGEETALRLWREQGVRVLPGAYMGREITAGKNPVKPWLFLYPGGSC